MVKKNNKSNNNRNNIDIDINEKFLKKCIICGKDFQAKREISKYCKNPDCKRKFTNMVNNGDYVFNKEVFNPKWFYFRLEQRIKNNKKLNYLKKEGLI